ncbi:polysaccharide pyruvyl transferase family protein [Sporomusa malonica]|uniref:Polysaccharide pyruvyl transferase n=1 Tax=Sporomusa malonica TaxID=112901 RepID=A0A1W2DKV3_9FIRM|nr:polysaccharide pyruvyl transferase family protein [Sporomusa malonica]SMC98067.1 Polysaccharide pyruvyl transferase [Sporomusa malonica]
MKNIGILTFHASHNYGSVLQAYALSKQLMLMGNQVEIVNLRVEKQKKKYKIFRTQTGIAGAIRTAFTALIYTKLKKRFDKYEDFIANTLPTTKKQYTTGKQLAKENFDYDTYVCGSDQIWNPACPDFDTAYYLDFLKNNVNKIAYAPSLGKTKFDEQTVKRISQLLKNVNHISVREKQGAEFLRTLTNKSIEVVCDPVVLLEKQCWEEIIVEPKVKKPYILSYFLSNNHGDRSMLDYLQQKTGFDVIVLNEYIRDYFKPYQYAIDAGPGEFLGLFKNASLIYTNSFHGTAFSAIFNKPFFTSVAKDANAANNNDSRKFDFLEKLNLSHRIITDTLPDIETILNLDYKEVNRKMREFRKHSLTYLQNAISSC